MAKKKIYAVRKGKVIGIFKSWDECKDSVEGYPGAEYKSFFSEEEANEYLSGLEKEVVNITIEKGEECLTADQVIAYVDGSFDEKIGKYAFGCVIITPKGEVIRESGNGDNPETLILAIEKNSCWKSITRILRQNTENLERGLERWFSGLAHWQIGRAHV